MTGSNLDRFRPAGRHQRGSSDPLVMIFLGCFGLIGLGFLIAALWIGLQQHTKITSWPRTDASVSASRVVLTSPTMYGAEAHFAYTVDGKPYEAVITPGYQTSVKSSMEGFVARYAPGSRHRLAYDPADPSQLSTETEYSLSAFMLPLIFAPIGLLLLAIPLAPWIWKRLPRRRNPGFQAGSHSSFGTGGVDRMPLYLGGSFTALGLILLLVCGGMAMTRVREGNWPTAQARVVESRMIEYLVKGRDYYAVEAHFSYPANGKDYTTMTSAESGSRDKAYIADQVAHAYAPGTVHSLRYNPGNPSDVRFREGDMTLFWILLFIGVMFSGIGTVVMVVFRPGKI